MSSSAKRAHTPLLQLSQILPQPEDAMEVNVLCEELVRFSMQPVSFTITTLLKSWIVMRQLLSSLRCKSSECSN